ncbi:MAG: hypothetical protein LUC88_00005, partial [Prevotella sp.]|nr:hypothetical protein [Prevotella sp.]
SGMNIICTDKSKLDKADTLNKLQKWINSEEEYSYTERHYSLIKRKIICEEFIEGEHGKFPYDYKFICLKGEPVCVLACTDRESGEPNMMRFSLNWEPLPQYNKKHRSFEVPRPKHLTEMIEYARKLSSGIDLVRIDLYDAGKCVYFGEITLTPAGGIFDTWSMQALRELGEIYRGEKTVNKK